LLALDEYTDNATYTNFAFRTSAKAQRPVQLCKGFEYFPGNICLCKSLQSCKTNTSCVCKNNLENLKSQYRVISIYRMISLYRQYRMYLQTLYMQCLSWEGCRNQWCWRICWFGISRRQKSCKSFTY